MLSIVFHLLLTAGILWYQRAREYKLHALTLTAIWYGISTALVFIAMNVLSGQWFSGLLLQGMVISLFYTPGLFFALRWAEGRKASMTSAFGFFLCMSIIATIVASLVLARAEIVKGLSTL